MKHFSLRQAGFTLVEMMVAVAIGLLMLAIIGGIYVSSTRSFAATGAMVGMDENARVIFDLIGGSVRQAGFDGCGRASGATRGDTRGVAVDGAKIPLNWWENTAQPVRGATLSAADGRFPGSSSGSDALLLVGVDSQDAASVISDDGVTITTGPHHFDPGQALLATSCQINSFFVATAGTGGDAITHASPPNCSANLAVDCVTTGIAAAGAATLRPGSLVLPVVAHAYYIAPSKTHEGEDNSAAKGKSLWSCTGGTPDSCTEQANGVENLVLWFGLDSDANGSVDTWARPGGVADWSQVIAVRAHLLLTTLPDAGAVSAGGNKYTFNGVEVTPTDRRVYREYTALFSVRNKTL